MNRSCGGLVELQQVLLSTNSERTENVGPLVEAIDIRDKRIRVLEDSLRESVSIAIEREQAVRQEVVKKKQITEKVSAGRYCIHIAEKIVSIFHLWLKPVFTLN